MHSSLLIKYEKKGKKVLYEFRLSSCRTFEFVDDFSYDDSETRANTCWSAFVNDAVWTNAPEMTVNPLTLNGHFKA